MMLRVAIHEHCCILYISWS